MDWRFFVFGQPLTGCSLSGQSHFPDSLGDDINTRKPRHYGHLVHLQDSKSGGWGIIRDPDGEKFFTHLLSLLDPATRPAVGWNVMFTILPPLPNQPLRRATGVKIMPSTRGMEA
jgi:hypothetical protein